MTSKPTYDYPEPYANPRQGAVTLHRNVSLVGRLRLTQPVWLQLGINSAAALHILQREPAGTFLVRRSNTRRCQVLCLRLLDDSSPAFVTTYCLCQERAAITLEGSDRSFPTLLHLIAFYCSVPILEFLPQRQGIHQADFMGICFSVPSSRSPQGPNRSQMDGGQPAGACGLPTPFLDDPSLEDVSVRRQYFKSNVKVQVSTEAVSPLSPPAAPPPPIPVGKKQKLPHPPQPHASDGKSRFSNCTFQTFSTEGGCCAARSKDS